MNEWKNIKVELPSLVEDVLLLDMYGCLYIGYLTTDNHFKESAVLGKAIEDVAYWCCIPKLPKEYE